MSALLSLLACLVGLVLYAISSNAKVAEIGRLLFFAGALATLLVLSHEVVRLLP